MGSRSLARPVHGVPETTWRACTSSLFARTSARVAVVDLDGKAVFCNRAFTEAFGGAPGDALAERILGLGPALTSVLETGTPWAGAVPLGGADEAFIRLTPLSPEQGPWGVLCTVSAPEFPDTRGAMERALEDMVQELDAIIDSSSSGLWVCDGQARVLRINRASERLSGVKAEEVVGRTMKDLIDSGFIDDSVTLRVVKQRSKVHMLQQSRTGRKMMVTGHPVFDTSGRLIRVVTTERDITFLEELHRQLEGKQETARHFSEFGVGSRGTSGRALRAIFRSEAMVTAMRQALKIARVDATTLLLGESGSGKGMVAEFIHHHSRRKDQPFLRINCGAIPEALLESELFGYQKGAFTGAQSSGKAGYLEVADGGILFMDEIAELPLASQVKLLRFLDDGLVTRLGSSAARKVDVRILVATHRDLKRMVQEGSFREDLYYRLNVLPLRIPPLRERKECLEALLEHYLGHFSDVYSTRKSLGRPALRALLSYPYPGNVRELVNICHRLVALSDRDYITLNDLPREITQTVEEEFPCTASPSENLTLREILESAERTVLHSARERYATQCEMAAALGVNQSTIARKLQKYEIG